jgi:hypothetical protein
MKPELVVIDTMSQTFSGEENSAAEVSQYLRGIGLWFRATWQAAVLVVHHTGHRETERARGSSAIRANVDFMFSVFRDEKEMLATVECVKQKDGELLEPTTFDLRVVDLAVDEDGDKITSLVASAGRHRRGGRRHALRGRARPRRQQPPLPRAGAQRHRGEEAAHRLLRGDRRRRGQEAPGVLPGSQMGPHVRPHRRSRRA